MINSAGEKDFRAKQEGDNDSKVSKTTYGSRQWAGFKNPRIVRVSRSFGGKDRHSKVCTIRGLRDRRIRLSVPTAIQLYDLQERLGLSQPSKVVDWLIDNTKDDIDKLPPLQMTPGDFSQFHQATTLVPHDLNSTQSSFSPFFDSNTTFMKDAGNHRNKQEIKINDLNDGSDQRMKGKEIENEGGNGAGLNFFPLPNPSFPSFPYNPYYNWEPSNLSLSQYGNQGFSSQTDSSHSSHPLSLLPSSLTLPSASQFFFGPPAATTPPLFPPFPPYMTALGETHDPRQVNHFQLLSSSSQHVISNPLHNLIDSQGKPIPSNLNSKVHSQNNDDSQLNKGKNISLAQNFLS